MDTTITDKINEPNPAKALPKDLVLGILSFISIIMSSLLWFYLGAVGPGITLWMYLLIGAVILLVSQALLFLLFKRATVWYMSILRSILAPIILVALIGNIFGFGFVLGAPILLVPVALVILFIRIYRRLFKETEDHTWLFTRLLFGILLLGISISSLVLQFTSFAGIDMGWARLLGLRKAVVAKVELDELQQAALELMDYDNQRGADERPLDLSGRQITEAAFIPNSMRRLNPLILHVSRGENQKAEYVILIWGSGMHEHNDLIVGRSSLEYREGRGVQKWKDGIYIDLNL